MARASADKQRRQGVEGYYVVNRDTDITVAGPIAEHTAAQREANRRNLAPPATPGLLEVRLVGESKVPAF